MLPLSAPQKFKVFPLPHPCFEQVTNCVERSQRNTGKLDCWSNRY